MTKDEPSVLEVLKKLICMQCVKEKGGELSPSAASSMDGVAPASCTVQASLRKIPTCRLHK